MNLLEKMVVTPEFCAREDVYNIKEGGEGGWDIINNETLETFIENKNISKKTIFEVCDGFLDYKITEVLLI